ncbi:hypothetical protein DID88_006388 [Monilinia fructigena]|uniref:NADP-dependent oxidoreductase domain-containing protein n=1 Tax=Monilinia fructigena TaxID=38457 RepID=A0A395IDE8_9HELO|nr:hypothetical protein DID88_006388 [Monilinia fructigena]
MKYTNLGESGLRVSRICVGCMTFGDRRGSFKTWAVEEADALPILNACYESGINFFDTANVYSNGTSEEILGAAIKNTHFPGKTSLWRQNSGRRVDASLKRLGLDYIDLLQIHRFDARTPIKETMKALHDVVESGKVRYIGSSSMWAHQLLEMQYTARMNGWTEFISMQNLHNAAYREEEREMVPSLRKFGMGMIPWSPVMMGYLARPHDEATESDRGKAMSGKFMGNELTEADIEINEKIQEIAKKRGVSMAVVAIAWSLSKEYVTAPIVGMGKI